MRDNPCCPVVDTNTGFLQFSQRPPRIHSLSRRAAPGIRSSPRNKMEKLPTAAGEKTNLRLQTSPPTAALPRLEHHDVVHGILCGFG